MQLYILIATTDVPHIIEVYNKEQCHSAIKAVVRTWARSKQLISEDESVRTLKEPNKPGVWLEQTSFGWLLKRVVEPVAGWLYTSAATSTILAEIRLTKLEECSVLTSFAQQRDALLELEQKLENSRLSYAEQAAALSTLRNEVERDQQEQMLSLLLELEKHKKETGIELEKLNFSLADVLYTAQVLLSTLNQTAAKLEAANQQLVMSEAIFEVELQQERCASVEFRQQLEQAKAELKHQLDFVHPDLCYKHEIELMAAQTAMSNLRTEYALAKEKFQAQLEEAAAQRKQLEQANHELASHNLEQAFDVCLLQSVQSNLRSQLEQKEQLYSDALDKLSSAKDQAAYERQLWEREQQVNKNLDDMCQELCAEVNRLRSESRDDSADAWVCQKLMEENEHLQACSQDLINRHNVECDQFRAFIAEQSNEYTEKIVSLERRLQSQAQTIKNFQDEKVCLLATQKQLQEERDQLKWSNTLYADQLDQLAQQAKQQAQQQQQPESDDRDHELAILRSKLEAAEQRQREMEENLEQTLRMSEERRAMLNSREKESDIYFEQWQNCCQALEEKARELDRLITAQQESANKVTEKQKRISELETMVRKMEADLAYVVDLHWGRSLQ